MDPTTKRSKIAKAWCVTTGILCLAVSLFVIGSVFAADNEHVPGAAQCQCTCVGVGGMTGTSYPDAPNNNWNQCGQQDGNHCTFHRGTTLHPGKLANCRKPDASAPIRQAPQRGGSTIPLTPTPPTGMRQDTEKAYAGTICNIAHHHTRHRRTAVVEIGRAGSGGQGR